MATIDVKDAAGATQTVGKYLPGRAAAADSSPAVLSTEDKTSLDVIGTLLTALNALVSGTDSQLPAALVGGKLSVTDPTSLPLPIGAATQATLARVASALPLLTSVTITTVQTSATGANFAAFGSLACEVLDIVNARSGAVDIEVRRGGAGSAMVLPAGSARLFTGITNASQLEVRRVDQSNTQVTVNAEGYKL